MRMLLILIVLLCGTTTVKADRCQLTVVAKSGLSMRKAAQQDGEKLLVVPFAAIVTVEGPCAQVKASHKNDLIEIDGKKGKWLEVMYEGKSGFMFSGYLVLGTVFHYNSLDTVDHVIIDEYFGYEDEQGKVKGDYFYHKFYSPHLNWYGIELKNEVLQVHPIDLQANYKEDRWENHEVYSVDVNLELENSKRYKFLLGSKSILSPSSIPFKKYTGCNPKESGEYFFPDTGIKLESEKHEYVFIASEAVAEAGSDTVNKSMYQLQLLVDGNEVEIFNKRKTLSLFANAEMHQAYRNPQLVASADLNQDGYLDFFFRVNPMQDSCGLFPYLKFIYSKVGPNGLEYRSNDDWMDIDNFY